MRLEGESQAQTQAWPTCLVNATAVPSLLAPLCRAAAANQQPASKRRVETVGRPRALFAFPVADSSQAFVTIRAHTCTASGRRSADHDWSRSGLRPNKRDGPWRSSRGHRVLTGRSGLLALLVLLVLLLVGHSGLLTAGRNPHSVGRLESVFATRLGRRGCPPHTRWSSCLARRSRPSCHDIVDQRSGGQRRAWVRAPTGRLRCPSCGFFSPELDYVRRPGWPAADNPQQAALASALSHLPELRGPIACPAVD